MVVRSPIYRKGSLWGSVPGARAPPVHSVYQCLLCLSTLAGQHSVMRNTAANQTDKEAALMKLPVWREARTE